MPVDPPPLDPPAPDPSDRAELLDLAARYAWAVDGRRFEELRHVFRPDAVLETEQGRREGIDEILTVMERLRRYAATQHLVGQQLVVAFDLPTDGAATAETVTWCSAHHLSDHGDHRTELVMQIRYHDRVVRTDGGWRLAHRRLEVPWSEQRRLDADGAG